MKQALIKAIKSSMPLACLYYIVDAWHRRRRLRRGVISTKSGMRHAALPVEQSLAYIEKVWRDYLSYSRRQSLSGRIVEIGPGDNFGVALLLIKHGARDVVAIDKFHSERDSAQQSAIYRALSERYDMASLFSGPPSEATILNVSYRPGMPAELYFEAQNLSYDAVISRAVLEHLDDPLLSLDAMWSGLNPGGILVHRIDLRDHGMFAGAHPLTFLRPSVGLYRMMAADTGRPNRILLPAYREHLRRRNWPGRLGITRLVGVEGEFAALSWEELPREARNLALARVAVIKPRLAVPFRTLADEDLAVAGFVLVAEKPS